MGISWKIHKDQRLITFHLFGPTGILETVDSLRDLGADPDFDPAMRRLYHCEDNMDSTSGLDSTQGAFVDVLADQVVQMFDHPATVAFVYSRGNEAARDRFRVTAHLCDELFEKQGKGPMNHQAFNDLAQALDWLGLPADLKLDG